ncbi:MAG: response regulator transcription factor [Planctomycetota bacterium]|nr:response regulator transcription factor [Planctomycetota bacterium]
MSDKTSPSRILIVDDHQLVREGLTLRISLEPDLCVCGEAASPNEALVQLDRTRPDLIIVDLSLKGGDGLGLIKQIKARNPHAKMLVVTGFQESLYGERVLRAGALGFLNKQESTQHLIDAIRTVLAGRRYVSKQLEDRLIAKAISGEGVVGESATERLSDRELEVFRLIGEGRTSGAIAQQLFLSPHTVDTHRENIKRKLGLANAGELSQAAVQWVLEGG